MNDFYGNSISIDGFTLEFKEIPIKDLELSNEDIIKCYKKSKVEYFNNLLNTSASKLDDFRGVYVFVVNEHLELSDSFFQK